MRLDMQHTSGSWDWHGPDWHGPDWHGPYMTGGYKVTAFGADNLQTLSVYITPCEGQNTEANARLIAAAPKLLEFVSEIAAGRNATTRDLPPSIRRDAKALYALATGSDRL